MARTSYLRRPLTAVLIAAALAASVLMAAVMLASPAHAATLTVTNNNDSGPNSLRQAMLDANASGVANTIDFAPSLVGKAGQIKLDSQLPVIIAAGGGLTIDGRGAGITIDQLAEARVFKVDNNATLTLDSLQVQDGYASGPDGYGGGIYNYGGYLTVRNSTIAYNKADLGGGGIYNTHWGWIEVSNTTISRNSAGRGGGGIFNDFSGTFYAWNTTIYENSVYNDGVPGSTQGGGGILLGVAAYAKLSNTIVANNQVPSQEGLTFPNCRGEPAEQGYNLDSGTSCGFSPSPDPRYGSLSNTDPKLGFLTKRNGGPTETLALEPDSPAINRGSNSSALEGRRGPALQFDQRGQGFPRIVGGSYRRGEFVPAVDIGAFEFQGLGGGGSGSPPTGAPEDKQACKKGGFREFGFKNQGQCIKAVNHAG